MSMIDLDELMKLREAATPGPWKSCTDEVYVCGELSYYDYVGNAEGQEVVSRITSVSEEDSAYICAACNAIPELVARIRELEAQLRATNTTQVSALEPCRIVPNNNSTPPEWLMRRFTEVK